MPSLNRLAPVTWFCAVLLACSPQQPDSQLPSDSQEAMPNSANDSGALVASLEVEPSADNVQMILRVTNPTSDAVTLTFSSGQTFDFVVEQDGRTLWRWSGDQMFTQAFHSETLAPGGTREYSAAWIPPTDLSGEVTVRGLLTAVDNRLEQETVIQLP